jgi:hypothetical protein
VNVAAAVVAAAAAVLVILEATRGRRRRWRDGSAPGAVSESESVGRREGLPARRVS